MGATRRLSMPIAAFLLVSAALAADRPLTLDPENSALSFTLGATGHEVAGTLSLLGGELRFDPDRGTVLGEITVDARKTQTGNAKRDRTMHRKVLESETYPTFVFRPARFDGQIPASGEGQITLHGTLSIHGDGHPLSLPVTVSIDGRRLRATTAISVPFVEWGMEDPSFLFLRVDKQVEVSIELAGRLGSGHAAGP